MKKKKFPIREITVIAQFAALTAICSWLQIPAMTIPFTMQTFAVFLSVYVLGIEKGFLSVLVYILLGAAGLPVFSRFQGGLGVIAGPTGGASDLLRFRYGMVYYHKQARGQRTITLFSSEGLRIALYYSRRR